MTNEELGGFSVEVDTKGRGFLLKKEALEWLNYQLNEPREGEEDGVDDLRAEILEDIAVVEGAGAADVIEVRSDERALLGAVVEVVKRADRKSIYLVEWTVSTIEDDVFIVGYKDAKREWKRHEDADERTLGKIGGAGELIEFLREVWEWDDVEIAKVVGRVLTTGEWNGWIR